jgi:hypothetical protein
MGSEILFNEKDLKYLLNKYLFKTFIYGVGLGFALAYMLFTILHGFGGL